MIIQNAIKIIEDVRNPSYIKSRNTHDYVQHTFKNGNIIACDGGGSYIRRCGDIGNSLYEEWCLNSEDTFDTIKNKLLWGTYGKDGKGPFKYVLLKECETKHLRLILKEYPDVVDIYKKVITSILEDRKNY